MISGSVTFTRAKYRIFVSLPFSQNLVLLLFTPPLPPIPISHVRECFSLLVQIAYIVWHPMTPIPGVQYLIEQLTGSESGYYYSSCSTMAFVI